MSFAVIKWLDVFIRDEYKNILIDSLHYCQQEKGMEIFAWCIVIDEKINYVHHNPVEEYYVFRAEDYMYSSAIDYAGEKGLLNDVIVVK